MSFGYDVLNKLQNRELLTPYFENAMLADNWPEEYSIKIDSRPKLWDKYFHPSSHTTQSERWLYYQMHPDHQHQLIRRKFTLVDHMTLGMGKAAHGIVQTQLEMMGLVGPDDIEISLKDDLNWWRGHCDWRLHHPNGKTYAVEMKTQNSRAFNSAKGPKQLWLNQLNPYMDALGVDEGIIFVVEMGYPFQIREYHIYRDEEILTRIYSKWRNVREAIAENTPPRHCCGLGSADMKKCSNRFACWLAESPA